MSSTTSLTTAAVGPGEAHTAANRTADGSRAVAGWYESSWELIRGLEVTEVLLPHADNSAGLGNGDGPLRTAC